MSEKLDLVAIETRAREAVEALDFAVLLPDGDVPLSELMRLGAAAGQASDTLRLLQAYKEVRGALAYANPHWSDEQIDYFIELSKSNDRP